MSFVEKEDESKQGEHVVDEGCNAEDGTKYSCEILEEKKDTNGNLTAANESDSNRERELGYISQNICKSKSRGGTDQGGQKNN